MRYIIILSDNLAKVTVNSENKNEVEKNMSEMNSGRDESIGKRITTSFTRNTIFTAIIAAIVVVVMVVMSLIYTSVLENYGYAQGDIGRTMTYFAETRSATRAVIGYRDEDIVNAVTATHDEYKASFESSFEKIESTLQTDAAKQEYQQIKSKLTDYWALDSEIISLGSNVNDTQASKEAQSMTANELAPMYNEINDMLDDIMTIKVNAGNAVEARLKAVIWGLVLASIVVIVCAMVISYSSGRKIASQISSSLKLVSDRMINFAKGDLSSEFPQFDTNDEISRTADTASQMAENIRVIINDMDKTMTQISEGDFTVKCSCPDRYVGEFKTLRKSIASLEAKMKDTLLQIDDTSQRVDLGSAQLSESANALAQGALDQAGSVQQLTATISDMSNNAKETATRIDEAYKKGLFYKQKAESGREEVANLVKAMEAISKVSNEIKDIIGEIEDIASQTNLLSLNASIEAARAGDAGKGFAVVADQIGKLASDSAESAVRTRDLIQKALDEVEKGNETMVKTSETLQQVVEGIEFLSNVTKDASESSYAQVNTMEEVEKGIEQISTVVESNSSAAEETSSTGEELASQAASLKGLTQQFILR
jgi:methyl-accepting chemotaxis protein